MSLEGQQPGEGMQVLVCDDESACRDILKEMLGCVLPEGSSISEADTWARFQGVLGAVANIRLMFLDYSVFESVGLRHPRDCLNNSALRRAVVVVCSGHNYQALKCNLLNLSGEAVDSSRFLSLFAGKPVNISTLREIVRLACSFAVDDDQISVGDIHDKNIVLIGSGVKYPVSSQAVHDVDFGGGLSELAKLVPAEDAVSLSFAKKDVGILYGKIKEAFLVEFTAAFSGGAKAMRAFVGKVLDRKISFVMSSVLAGYDGGEEVFNHVIHDLRNAVAGNLKDNQFVSVAIEHLKTLKNGFERNSFVETVSVADFCNREGFDCCVPPDVCVKLPTGGIRFLIGNLFRNAERVAEDKFLSGGDVDAYRSFKIDVDVTVDEDEVVIKVSDNTSLFPDEYLDLLFRYPLSSGGSGRALLNMANMVRRFGGSIRLRQTNMSFEKTYEGFVLVTGQIPDGMTKQFEIRLPVSVV